MTEREYIEVQGKKYPLKTAGERARSNATNAPAPKTSSSGGGGGGGSGGGGGGGGPRISVGGAAARQVTLAMMVAGIVYGAAAGLEYVVDQDSGRERIANPLPKLGGWQALIGWGTMFVMLTIMADIGPTGPLAVAFAWLFVVVILFTYGIEAFENLQILMGAPTVSDAGGGGGSSKTLIQ